MRLRYLIHKTFQRFLEHDCMSSGASIAYFTIFSLPPLVIVLLTVANAAGFTKGEVDRVIYKELGLPEAQFGQPDSAADQPENLSAARGVHSVGNATNYLSTQFGAVQLGMASKIIGVVILLGSAIAIFAQLQDVLNRIWQVAPDPSRSWLQTFVIKRLLTAGMVILIWTILLVSLIFTAMIDVILEFVNGATPGLIARLVGILVNEGATLSLATIMFAALFKILPDAQMRWKDVWVGAGVTAVMFIIGKLLVGYYLQTCHVGSDWGDSAASTAAALVWVYYSSLIVLLGAEFTQVWATRDGHVAQPAAGAHRVERHPTSDSTPLTPRSQSI